jgi:phosphonatase-like hydrolase
VIRLVVLGVAGTSLAPASTVERAFDAALATAGLPPDDPRSDCYREVFDEMAGRPVLDVLRLLLGTEDRARESYDSFEKTFLAELPGRLTGARSDVPAVLGALRGDGIRTALTTGLERSLQDALLACLGWHDVADVAPVPDSWRSRGAPYPDLVLQAVLELRVDNVRHVAVAADSASTLLSGWAAGAWIVAGVAARHHQPALSVAPHTHLVTALDELPAVVSRPTPRERTGRPQSSGRSATGLSSTSTVPVAANTT